MMRLETVPAVCGRGMRRLLSGSVLLALVVVLASCTSLLRPNFQAEVLKLREGQYSIDPAHSFVLFKVQHLGLSAYVGRFNEFQAQMDFDPQAIDATTLQGTVKLTSIDTGNDEVDELLREPAWFDVANYPQAVFTTTSVQPLEANEIQITGDLTIRGVTQSVQLRGVFNGGADNLLARRYTIGFSATGSFSRSDFGMDNIQGLVGDEVSVEIFAEFHKSP